MGEIIALANQKGGCGKSLTSFSLGSGLAMRGYKILMVDTDPQANLSDTARADLSGYTVYDVFNGLDARKAIQKTGCDIIPGSLEMSAADMQFTRQGREYILKRALEDVKDDYDYIIIDTPPALGIITINALTAADRVIIPMQADRYNMQGIAQLSETIRTVREYSNKDLDISGILLTRHNGRTVLAKDIRAAISGIADIIGTFVYRVSIRQAVAMQEAQVNQQSIFDYDRNAPVALDYDEFIDEFLEVVKHGEKV